MNSICYNIFYQIMYQNVLIQTIISGYDTIFDSDVKIEILEFVIFDFFFVKIFILNTASSRYFFEKAPRAK